MFCVIVYLYMNAPHEVIISAHIDDGPLSCYNRLALGSESITVFAGIPESPEPSKWDLLTGYTNAQDSMYDRRAENDAALKDTNTTIRYLDFLDLPYADCQRDIIAIADAIESQVQSDSSLYLPAGIGTLFRNHPDHCSVREAGVILRDKGYNVVFYADVPYALPVVRLKEWPRRLSVEKLKRLLNSNVRVETVALDNIQQLGKMATVAAYRSQFKMVNKLANGALKRSDAYKWEGLIHCV